METAYYRATGKQLLLSEQDLMDCGWYLNNKACFGGYQVSFPMSRHRLICLVSVNAAVSMSADMLIRFLIL